jgi:NADH dehydrogenase FAD-containing subunit
VLGGGLVGHSIVIGLEKSKQVRLTLIDRKEFFENNLGTVRAIVRPEFEPHITVPHRRWLAKDTRLVVGEAVSIDTRQVEVETQAGLVTIMFDYLVIAVGSSYPVFKSNSASLAQRTRFMQMMSRTIEHAKSILIVGGGPVGVEALGEILDRYPQKRITLVHSGPRLLLAAPQRAHDRITTHLSSRRDVNILLNDSVLEQLKFAPPPDEANPPLPLHMTTYRTREGAVIQADFVINATGISPNTHALRPHMSPALDPLGWIHVNNCLQVHGNEHIFAAGDAIAAPHLKLAHTGNELHAPIVLENILCLVAGKPVRRGLDPSKAYRWPPLTSVGDSWGMMVLPILGGQLVSGGIFGRMKTRLMKRLPKPGNKAF